jgi:hypothetical protein
MPKDKNILMEVCFYENQIPSEMKKFYQKKKTGVGMTK